MAFILSFLSLLVLEMSIFNSKPCDFSWECYWLWATENPVNGSLNEKRAYFSHRRRSGGTELLLLVQQLKSIRAEISGFSWPFLMLFPHEATCIRSRLKVQDRGAERSELATSDPSFINIPEKPFEQPDWVTWTSVAAHKAVHFIKRIGKISWNR